MWSTCSVMPSHACLNMCSFILSHAQLCSVMFSHAQSFSLILGHFLSFLVIFGHFRSFSVTHIRAWPSRYEIYIYIIHNHTFDHFLDLKLCNMPLTLEFSIKFNCLTLNRIYVLLFNSGNIFYDLFHSFYIQIP